MTTIDTPIGRLGLRHDKGALAAIIFDAGAGPRDDGPSGRALRAYFAGDLHALDELPLAGAGTPFQREVWAALRAIPPGQTVSYGELARRIGRPAAARAVGAACHVNPIPIVVPCHRVVGKNGALVGYAGGLERKRVLLDLEARMGRSVDLSPAAAGVGGT